MIPKISHPLPTDKKSHDFFKQLKAEGFTGDIEYSYASRITYATDNSIYQVVPKGIVFPKSQADIQIFCRLFSLPIYKNLSVTSRGGGTGTNGQSITDGIVMDFSRHMNRIREINIQEGYAVVQPGVVPDRLNRELAKQGYFFAPSVSTATKATIGGMVSTDACGKGSRIYGKTSDHILDLTCVLADGSDFRTAEPNTYPEILQKLSRYLQEVTESKRTEIDRVFPKMNRGVSGYNLPEALDHTGRFKPEKLLAGSEGSLCFICEIKVKILPIPKFRNCALVKFGDFMSALSSAETIAPAEPDAVETIDDKVLTLAMEDEVSEKAAAFFTEEERKSVRSFNLVEFSGNSADELQTKISRFEALMREHATTMNCIGYTVVPFSQSAGLWEMRAKGVGLLANLSGRRKPVAFVEDCAVPVAVLVPFVAEFMRLLDSHSIDYAIYGHVDVGCMHIRPALDLQLPEDEAKIRTITDAVNELAVKYGGVLWGEHGKGYRGEYARPFFGEELFAVMCRIKTFFDPANRLNPGKIAVPMDAQNQPVSELTKIDGVATRGRFDRQINPLYRDVFATSILCNGNGQCFHHAADYVMCPSYKEGLDRLHSPKGRAGIVREWITRLSAIRSTVPLSKPTRLSWLKKIPNQIASYFGAYDFSHEVYQAMDNCLACKACTSQCPVKIDIPEQKSLFLAYYFTRYMRPLSDYLVRFAPEIAAWQVLVPNLSNRILGMAITQKLTASFAGMRDVPAISLPGLKERLQNLPTVIWDYPPEDADEKAVVFIQDEFTTYYDASVPAATVTLLNKIGYRVYIPPLFSSGKTAHVKGFLDAFRKIAEKNIAHHQRIAKSGLPVLFVEPSILLVYRQEYQKYFPRHVFNRLFLLQEWLADVAEFPKPSTVEHKNHKSLKLMLHCSEKTALPKAGSLWQKVFNKFGEELEVVSAGCCGMAGAYGHETRHYESSKKIYRLSWKTPAEEFGSNLLVTGYSCRSQVKRFSQQKCEHPVERLCRIIG